MSETPQRPAWFARRNISPFTLDEATVNEIIATATHAVVSWVTKDIKPVSAVMLYLLIDDVITITSTTNRAKYHAWRRFTEKFLTRNNEGEPPSAERLAIEIEKFDAPDRHMMQLRIDKVLTHDLFQLFQAEVEGTDVWS